MLASGLVGMSKAGFHRPIQTLALDAECCRSSSVSRLCLSDHGQSLLERWRVVCRVVSRRSPADFADMVNGRKTEGIFLAGGEVAEGFATGVLPARAVLVAMVSCCMDWRCCSCVASERVQIVVERMGSASDQAQSQVASYRRLTAHESHSYPSNPLAVGGDEQASAALARTIFRCSAVEMSWVLSCDAGPSDFRHTTRVGNPAGHTHSRSVEPREHCCCA